MCLKTSRANRYRSASMLSAVLILLATTALSNAQLTSWPQWRGQFRDGISGETDWSSKWPSAGPPKLWSVGVGKGCSSMAVVGNKLYTMGNYKGNDAVSCIDTNTGRVRWVHQYRCSGSNGKYGHLGGPGSTPTVDGERVYSLSQAGHLYCLSAISGDVIWTKHLVKDFGGRAPEWGYSCSPLIIDDMLILETGGVGNSNIALNKHTGEVIWQSGNGRAGYSSPVPFYMGRTKSILMLKGRSFNILDAKSGRELLTSPWTTSYNANCATPIVWNNNIFISSGYNKGGALLRATAAGLVTLWKTPNLRCQMASPILWQGHLYGFDGRSHKPDTALICLDLHDGSVKWRQEGLGAGALIYANGKLIVQGEFGTVSVIEASPAGCNVLAETQVFDKSDKSWVAPVLSGGKLFCRTNKGTLTCLDIRK